MKELMKDHSRRGGPPKSDDNDAAKPQREDPAKARFEREISYTQMQRSMMCAYFQMFAAFEREERVNVAAPVYSSRVIRYQHRFAAFQSLHFPVALTYDDYLKNSDFSRYGVDLIYKSAEECFKVTRTHSDELLTLVTPDETTDAPATCTSGIHADEARDVVHVAVANLVELARHEQDQRHASSAKSSRQRGAKAAPTASTLLNSVNMDFSKHQHFPVLAIARSTEHR